MAMADDGDSSGWLWFGEVCVSVLALGVTCLWAEAARFTGRHLLQHRPFALRLWLEAAASWELCAACYELALVADQFSVATYAVLLWLLTVWWGWTWSRHEGGLAEVSACPYTHLERCWTMRSRGEYVGEVWRDSLVVSLVQLAGGVASYHWVSWYWRLRLVEHHWDAGDGQCQADLQVHWLLGLVVEALGTCLCRLGSATVVARDLPVAPALDALFSTLMVVAAFDLSGGYFNPVLASSLKAGCVGHTMFQHVAVYWLGACSGALLSLRLLDMPVLQSLLRLKLKED